MTREWRWTPGQTVLPGAAVPAPSTPAPSTPAPSTPAPSAAVPSTPAPGTSTAGTPTAGAAAAGAAAYGVAPTVPVPSTPAAPPAPLRHVAPLTLAAADDESAASSAEPADVPADVPPPRASLPTAVPGSSLARWISYFDAVEQAALAVAEKIAEGHSPTWPDLVVPAPTLPASMVARRDEVLALVDDVTARAERRRDVIASELSALAPPAARAALPAGLGATLDVVG